MIARAPGKLFATGAYAVLSGAPAVVLAVDRFVEARTDRAAPPLDARVRPEVAAVARHLSSPAPFVDTSALEENGRKLGLGSSAAAAVASAAAILGVTDVPRVMEVALQAHRSIQPRGSGADIAACTLGGALIVRVTGQGLRSEPFSMRGVVFRAFSLARSLRTSDALDRLEARRELPETASALARLVEAAHAGAEAFRAGDASDVVAAARAHVEGLRALSTAVDLPLVPPELERARDVLNSPKMSGKHNDFTLLPSGAGGGDTVLWLGARAPNEQEALALLEAGLRPLSLRLAERGVHTDAEWT